MSTFLDYQSRPIDTIILSSYYLLSIYFHYTKLKGCYDLLEYL